jgi:hypothetical protein
MSGSDSPRKLKYSSSIWLGDEFGNIFYARRDVPDPNATQIIFTRVSKQGEQFDFKSRDELHQTPGLAPAREDDKHDGSVAAVKMLLAMGVAVASMPKPFIFCGHNVTLIGTSYVINLASFEKETHAFWPDETTSAVSLEPVPPLTGT